MLSSSGGLETPSRLALVELPLFLYYVCHTNVLLTQFYLHDKYMRSYTGNGSSVNVTKDIVDAIQADTTMTFTYILITLLCPAIFVNLLVGPLSDQLGRKPFLIMVNVASFVKVNIDIIVMHFDLHVGYLFIGNMIYGLGGSYALMLTCGIAMVADVTPIGPQRSFRITTSCAAIAVGVSLGISITGVLIDSFGFVFPAVLYAVASFTNVLFVWCVLPETVPGGSLRSLCLSDIIENIQRGIDVYGRSIPSLRRISLLLSLLAGVLILSIVKVEMTLSSLFLLAPPFNWTSTHVALYYGVKTVISWAIILVSTKCLLRYCSDLTLAIFGCLSLSLDVLLIGIADTDSVMYIAACVGLYGDQGISMVRTFMSKCVPLQEQVNLLPVRYSGHQPHLPRHPGCPPWRRILRHDCRSCSCRRHTWIYQH
ncbi:proton-coupled folate transporter-like isoform X3 [Haliotis rufescens]|uniref:proton-coupled folate transporter-like isoform X3 n=1 Tax=Haliotis rufescens TaxID=6454 RepID=UPI00201F122F|nr:proton-coupled folate transporter-like isoform X3 [Haliotis rufescens]